MTQPPSTSPYLDSTSSTRPPFQLALMRHAKSDWSGGDTSDHDRPLNDRGLRDAPRMSRWIAESGLLPDHILCSSAVRTQQTAALMQSYWKYMQLEPGKLQIVTDLYLAPADTIFEIVGDLAGTSSEPFTVLVLGHNPGVSYAASQLLGCATAMSTAAVVALRCDIPDWSTPLTFDNTDMVAAMKPKSLDFDVRLNS